MLSNAYTFDDILLVPSYSTIQPNEAIIETHFSKRIPLHIPLVSSAMDTVTESKLAITLAQQGGIGVIHRNLSQEEQVREVRIVKRAANGIIHHPAVMSPDTTIKDAQERMVEIAVSSFPIVKGNRLVGIMTNRDLRSQIKPGEPVSSIMTKKVITALEGTTLDEAQSIMRKQKIEKLIVVNKKGELRGLICMKDIQDNLNYPMAVKDRDGRLRVAAAIGTGEIDFKRAKKLVAVDVDALVIDTAHAHHKNTLNMIKRLKKTFKNIDVVAGNIATKEAAVALIKAGADAIKVGIGPGSICTTRIIAGVGVPQVTAIMEVCEIANKKNIPVIADGGIKHSGDIAKALALGASSVMIGSLFAGSDEAPGETIFFDGRRYKVYRGMGSLGAMANGSSDRYHQGGIEHSKLVPEGIEGGVPVTGPLVPVVAQLIGGLKSSMGYLGAKDLKCFTENAKFVKMSNSGLRESHVHDVIITKEASNYRIDHSLMG